MPALLSSSAQSGARFRVAISGAGIAGLVLAITIGKYDPSIPIDLYDPHDSIETTGVGIMLRRHGILSELGLLEDLQRIFTYNSDTRYGLHMRRSDIREGGYAWYQVTHRYATCAMHRQHMMAILAKHLPPLCTVHFRKRLTVYTEPEDQTSPIKLEFADGTSATADILIGADGIRSVVRKTLFEVASMDQNSGHATDLKQYAGATFTGMTIHWCLISAERLRKENPNNISLKEMTSYHGMGKCLVTYPIANGSMINCEASICDPSLLGVPYEEHWLSNATSDELAEHFDTFEDDARTVIKLYEDTSKRALHVVKPLPFCVRKRVALIGDACHGMSPHFGAAVGHAIKDGFVLGRLITHPLMSLSRIPDAFRIYEEVCLPLARDVASVSLSIGWMQSFMEPGYYDGTRKEDDLDDRGISAYEKEGMETIQREIQRCWNWIEGLDDDLKAWEEAESKLLTLLAN